MEKAKKARERDCYIKPIKAWKLMKAADEENMTTYIYGVTGSGKTSLVKHYMIRQKETYDLFDAETLRAEELKLPSAKTRRIVVIDNLHRLAWENDEKLREAVLALIRREDIWLILSGRCPVLPWMSDARFREGFYVIDEELLFFSPKDVKRFTKAADIILTEEMERRLVGLFRGYPLAWYMLYQRIRENDKWRDCILGVEHYEKIFKWSQDHVWDYLEFHVYDQWEPQMQEFLMEVSIVDSFTVRMAEMITGERNIEWLIERARWMGNFLREKICPDGSVRYELYDPMGVSMRRRIRRKYSKEKLAALYENAGLCYQLDGESTKALEMYQEAGATERMVSVLVDNVRRAPTSADYYALKQYYFALSEDIICQNPELMTGMSMLQSLLLNPEESERWYQQLVQYAKEHRGSERKLAKSRLLFLDISLLQRGSEDMINIFKQSYRLLFERKLTLYEFSVTGNQPSQMNGGKDFCEWSKRDRELARSIGKVVEFILGRYGKGMVDLALAESFLEKGEDNYEVSFLANRGRMQAEAGGKLEQCFVADGILAWLHIQNGRYNEALELMQRFWERAQKENAQQLLPNIRTFQIRCALYAGERAMIAKWMETAPDEEIEFRTYDRFQFLTKVRVYLQMGRYEQAYNLLVKLQYYASMMKRTYILMECDLLMAVTLYRMGQDEWETFLDKVLTKACEYHFVRLLSREGVALQPLLARIKWPADASEDEPASRQAFLKEVCSETDQMARYYPGYLKAGQKDVRLSDTAVSILKLQAEGMSRADIAKRLHMTEANVKYHMAQNYKKLGVKNKAAAVMEGKKRGLI